MTGPTEEEPDLTEDDLKMIAKEQMDSSEDQVCVDQNNELGKRSLAQATKTTTLNIVNRINAGFQNKKMGK